MVFKSETNRKNISSIDSLIAELANKDGMARQRAREALVQHGNISVPSLINALSHPRKCVRWEAAKALTVIADPRSIPAFVQKLSDKSYEVRWLAAEGLIALKQNSLRDLLKALLDEPDNWDLRQGAHHVLHALERENLLNKSCLNLLNQLRNIEGGTSMLRAAEKALSSLP